MKPIILAPTAADLALARRTAFNIQQVKERAHIPSRKVSGGSDVEIHAQGKLGEIVVARWLGVLPNTTAYFGGDGGIDLMYGGLGWDIKTRYGWALDLLIKPDMADFRADGAILCWLLPDYRVALVGYVLHRQFLKGHTNDGKRLVYPFRNLKDIQQFKRIYHERQIPKGSHRQLPAGQRV